MQVTELFPKHRKRERERERECFKNAAQKERYSQILTQPQLLLSRLSYWTLIIFVLLFLLINFTTCPNNIMCFKKQILTPSYIVYQKNGKKNTKENGKCLIFICCFWSDFLEVIIANIVCRTSIWNKKTDLNMKFLFSYELYLFYLLT